MMIVPLDQQIKYFPDNDGIPVPGRKHGIPGLPSLIQYFLNNLQNLGFVKQWVTTELLIPHKNRQYFQI